MAKNVDSVNQSGESGDDVVESVHAVMHAFRSRQYRAVRETEQGLSHLDGKVLWFFARHPGATQRDLAEHAARDKGQVARLVGALRERGLLEAVADETDRRVVRLQLTAQGRAVQQRLGRERRALAAQAVQGLDERERAMLVALLRRVRENLASE